MSKKFGILAYPAGHSLSPAMHNAAFKKLGIDASYEFFETPPEKLEEFIQRVRTEHIDGLSISIPHKEKIIPLLDEVTDAAQEIGAVNTVFWRDKKLVGDNTDWLGFSKSFDNSIENKKVVVLGGGGAARAIIYALLKNNCEVSVITREAWEFEGLQKDFGERIKNYDFIQNLDNYSPEILVNSTPLGMKGKFEEMSFVDPVWFESHQALVFDIVYSPRETKLVQDAKAAGCETIEGLQMLVNQAVAQFEKFTNQKIEVEMMWSAAIAELEK
ncbi:shikimate dehydrogenase [Candidatus Gracilibacteria bacterium]|nr:shikimate dehydrogenase [Candidatus Gracilibacteria bacterium]MCF7855996.1 shikimate dehydrogenase [Candidatus Gracilibacteria bacterium]MCF7896311.1 shikimate dehydrogenase [Candidatus Gracilibacteria bacterium]